MAENSVGVGTGQGGPAAVSARVGSGYPRGSIGRSSFAKDNSELQSDRADSGIDWPGLGFVDSCPNRVDVSVPADKWSSQGCVTTRERGDAAAAGTARTIYERRIVEQHHV